MPGATSKRVTTQVGDSSITVTLVDGVGPAIVLLPSYGRDGGQEYDDFTARAVEHGWCVLRPQPRGALGSVGPMEVVTFRDLAQDVAGVIGALADGPVVVVGHAFGNLLSRMVATEHSGLVKAVALVSSQAKEVPERIAQSPFVVGDPTRPVSERLAVLQDTFFAPGNDARAWLDGWYPETLRMQRAAVRSVPLQEYWRCGSVPLLEVTPEHDAFKPHKYWNEMRDDFGGRVTTVMIAGAGHALFPEQPEAAAEAILSWARRFR
ncbi:MAG: alpha/beta hydrolase [Actinomycetia bacterium]|nr:alpha/beta hydrolase [Actinomycetes bacterium]